MLSCRDITERVTDHMEGELTGLRGLELRMHLWLCRHCRRYVEQIRQVVALAAGLRAPPPDAPPTAVLALRRRDRPGR